jgi:putative membrane protein
MRITLAVLHLLALGIGLGAVYARARTLNRITPDALGRAFVADSWWGVAALLWIITGLWRAIAGIEKTPSYYWTNHVFYAKMAFLLVVLVLEVWPAATLIRWRVASRLGTLPAPDALARTGKRIARISDVQTALVIAMVVAAVMMARGFGAR